ncbi:MAG: flagellar biosynthetic protein FliR [Methylococcales bacterium]|nr:flagellar biosynthetic protein FliR [Methylococcales bacterium]MBT4032566.1 flagellar biosynthetic protein FliR [Methylococcales bacterium]MBT4663644.1 flagellar biosynthetic protein FliR [Methylococcales bacterium]
MIILWDDIIDWFYTFLWPFSRISAVLLVAPIFSSTLVTVRTRISLALLLTFLIYPLYDWPIIDVTSGLGFVLFLQQVLIGVAIGLIMHFAFAAITSAGAFIATSMGLSMAVVADPVNGHQSPVLAQVLLVLATLVFLSIGGHLIIIEMMLDSFRLIPINEFYVNREMLWAILQWSSLIFSGAIMIALPAMVTMLLTNSAMGVISRAAPALNVFAVGFPASLFFGLVMIYLLIPFFGSGMENVWFRCFEYVRIFLGVA